MHVKIKVLIIQVYASGCSCCNRAQTLEGGIGLSFGTKLLVSNPLGWF